MIVDKLPNYFPLADCRDGYRTGFKANDDDTVSIKRLYVSEPLHIKNVDASQLWCLDQGHNECGCPTNYRGHVQTTTQGIIVNKNSVGSCKYLKANAESVSLTVRLGNFQFYYIMIILFLE